MPQPSFITWVGAWLLMFAILYGLSRARWGHTIIYYGAWLVVVLMIVQNNAPILRLLQAGNISQPM